MPPRVPDQITVGTLRFRVYQLGDGRFAFDYKDGSRRVVVKRQSVDALREEAKRVATGILNAETESLGIGPHEARRCVAARELLAPLRLEIDEGARLVSEAARILGDPQRIVEAARWFIQANPSTANSGVSVAAAVAEFLLSRRGADLSRVYLDKLDDDLEKFAEAFAGPLISVRAAGIERWLSELRHGRTDAALGARRRRNLRDKVITLFNFARDRAYLPAGLRHEAEKVQRPKIRRGKVPIYTAEEMKVLLEHAKPGELPALAIGAFAGLRSAEIERLEWHDLRLARDVILLPEEKSKTGEPRAIQLQPNLRKWLQPYAEKSGWVVPRTRAGGPQRLDNVLAALLKRCGIRSKRNGLRHSFGSYLCAKTKNIPAVAFEMGNTPAVVKRNYFKAVDDEDAAAWFGIEPADLSNVLPLRFVG